MASNGVVSAITVCQTEPISITMYPYGLYICTAAPTAPTTTTATDLSNCFRVYEGDGTSAVELTSTSVSRPAGTFTVPPAGVYTHAVLWAKNLMGVKNFVQVDTDYNWISIWCFRSSWLLLDNFRSNNTE